jgi:hypothetical protein
VVLTNRLLEHSTPVSLALPPASLAAKAANSKLPEAQTHAIEHLSSARELQPGDLIYTGTPEGVGAPWSRAT